MIAVNTYDKSVSMAERHNSIFREGSFSYGSFKDEQKQKENKDNKAEHQ